MLCKKYGVDTQNFAIDRIPDELKNKEPKDIKAELGKTQKAFKEITAISVAAKKALTKIKIICTKSWSTMVVKLFPPYVCRLCRKRAKGTTCPRLVRTGYAF